MYTVSRKESTEKCSLASSSEWIELLIGSSNQRRNTSLEGLSVAGHYYGKPHIQCVFHVGKRSLPSIGKKNLY